jgi:hypothetical protein
MRGGDDRCSGPQKQGSEAAAAGASKRLAASTGRLTRGPPRAPKTFEAITHAGDLPGKLGRQLVDDRRDHAARAAPRRPEVHEDRDLGLEDELVECVVVDGEGWCGLIGVGWGVGWGRGWRGGGGVRAAGREGSLAA